ncbi:hypothetical protein ACFQ2M_22600 [Kitasatospora saccharophila]|uniref:hypothetical protein n=1 Tax=Kitasatospora saccharophila TaxID=407973 RepID=UPI003641ABCC
MFGERAAQCQVVGVLGGGGCGDGVGVGERLGVQLFGGEVVARFGEGLSDAGVAQRFVEQPREVGAVLGEQARGLLMGTPFREVDGGQWPRW